MSGIDGLVLRWDHLIVGGPPVWYAVSRQRVLRGHESDYVHDGGGDRVQLLSLVLLYLDQSRLQHSLKCRQHTSCITPR
jgi:hypothetical protein